MLKIKNVRKVYNTGSIEFEALKGINITINEGDFVSIVGPSGSGKSTLMNIIGCLDLPTTGEYYIDGTEVNELKEDKLAELRNKKIGFVFQNFNLLSKLSALENVELPLVYRGIKEKKAKKIAREKLESVGLGDKLNNKPNELSGGQKQRVAVARALAGNPALLLADEPTGALDTRSGQEVMDIFKKLNSSGNTIVVITHDMDIAQQAKKIIKIIDGRILE